VLHFEFIDK